MDWSDLETSIRRHHHADRKTLVPSGSVRFMAERVLSRSSVSARMSYLKLPSRTSSRSRFRRSSLLQAALTETRA